MNFKKLADQAKHAIDKRGGTEALKGDLAELKDVATGKGTLKEKATLAADRLKTPGARPDGTSAPHPTDAAPTAPHPTDAPDAPPTAQDLPPRH